jgi:hypothetical protein
MPRWRIVSRWSRCSLGRRVKRRSAIRIRKKYEREDLPQREKPRDRCVDDGRYERTAKRSRSNRESKKGLIAFNALL